MFMAALCTIAKTWKQPKCLSVVEMDMWYIYYYSDIERMKFCRLQ